MDVGGGGVHYGSLKKNTKSALTFHFAMQCRSRFEAVPDWDISKDNDGGHGMAFCRSLNILAVANKINVISIYSIPASVAAPFNFQYSFEVSVPVAADKPFRFPGYPAGNSLAFVDSINMPPFLMIIDHQNRAVRLMDVVIMQHQGYVMPSGTCRCPHGLASQGDFAAVSLCDLAGGHSVVVLEVGTDMEWRIISRVAFSVGKMSRGLKFSTDDKSLFAVIVLCVSGKNTLSLYSVTNDGLCAFSEARYCWCM